MKYDILLWDVDDTLLDFGYSERWAIQHCFEQFGINISEKWIDRYSEINQSYWKRLEKGEVSKQEVMIERFRDLFREMEAERNEALNIDIESFAPIYPKALGKVYKYRDDSFELCSKLKNTCKQYLITNGFAEVQMSKLKLAGFDTLMDGIFISEKMQAVKPQKEFFDKCFAAISDFDKKRVLVIGDSLTSDMKGAANAGVTSCWYNPNEKELEGDVRPDYTIKNLWELLEILKAD